MSVQGTYIVDNSAFVSYAGDTSTISAPIRFRPSRPRTIVRSSRVAQPPVSGVPVPGASKSHLVVAQKVWDSQEKKLTRRIQSVNVNRQIDGVLDADFLSGFLDNALD